MFLEVKRCVFYAAVLVSLLGHLHGIHGHPNPNLAKEHDVQETADQPANPSLPNIQCFDCNNSRDATECETNTEQCLPNEMCSTQVDLVNGQVAITKGCLDKMTCKNKEQNNPDECRRGSSENNCYFCCEDSFCNKNLSSPKPSLKTPGNGKFHLDGKEIRILSGAMHYFRIVPEYWEDRLRKLKACGLNTVETYVPWNLHEEVKGEFNFKGILDVRKYIQLAQKIGLYVIFRPGPYICSEWDLGGLPSWLLHDPDMKLRSTYAPYKRHVEQFFDHLIPIVADLQYSNGGPIIAVQIENEYGSYGSDQAYMTYVKDSLVKSGITELLFTSDNDQGMGRGAAPGVLQTVNFQSKADAVPLFDALRKVQPGKPLMVMEFWSGWFDHWGEEHHTVDVNAYMDTLKFILESGSSVNMYMFHGGTNFGFMNGANEPYESDVTSYDYDALLTEHGEITPKYMKTRELLMNANINNDAPLPDTIPGTPVSTKTYETLTMESFLPLNDMLSLIEESAVSSKLIPMEFLDINQRGGQGYGFVCYRKKINLGSSLVLTGNVNDRAVLLHDHEEVGVISVHDGVGATFQLQPKQESEVTLDILVENMGRVNYATYQQNVMNEQRKGLDKPVTLDGQPLSNWTIFPLEMKQSFIEKANNVTWKKIDSGDALPNEPAMYKTNLNLTSAHGTDTFLDMREWNKGVVFVNGFNLGRYWRRGPQRTLYVPGPLLREGLNEFTVFELHKPGQTLKFLDHPVLE